MAHTAHKTEAEIKEHFEDEQVIDAKCKQLAQLIKDSKHFIFFTGAGVSTSSGIPDFRGPEGAWTLAAQNRKRTKPTTSTLKAIPTIAHMSIVKLLSTGHAKYLVSQNTDGLHRRSGVHPSNISELHGNSNLEICTKCGKEFLRDFRVRNAQGVHDHLTGRKCTCGGPLKDTIINFGENLPEKPLELAMEHGDKADLCLSLGSSLTVTPAANIPKKVGKQHKLVIVNLQITPLDKYAHLRIFGKTDDVMQRVMKYLNLPIPEFKLTRRVRIFNANENKNLCVQAIDVDNTPVTLFPKIVINNTMMAKQEPFLIPKEKIKEDKVKIVGTLLGHYNEPEVVINHAQGEGDATYILQFDPLRDSNWTVTKDTPLKDDSKSTPKASSTTTTQNEVTDQ